MQVLLYEKVFYHLEENFKDVDGYNEFYYLLHNDDARESVIAGEYENGLEHFIAVINLMQTTQNQVHLCY